MYTMMTSVKAAKRLPLPAAESETDLYLILGVMVFLSILAIFLGMRTINKRFGSGLMIAGMAGLVYCAIYFLFVVPLSLTNNWAGIRANSDIEDRFDAIVFDIEHIGNNKHQEKYSVNILLGDDVTKNKCVVSIFNKKEYSVLCEPRKASTFKEMVPLETLVSKNYNY